MTLLSPASSGLSIGTGACEPIDTMLLVSMLRMYSCGAQRVDRRGNSRSEKGINAGFTRYGVIQLWMALTAVTVSCAKRNIPHRLDRLRRSLVLRAPGLH